jgi:hypothetical protein
MSPVGNAPVVMRVAPSRREESSRYKACAHNESPTVIQRMDMPRDNRVKTTGFRATLGERKLIEGQAKKLNLRLSEYVRLCVLNDISTRRASNNIAEANGGQKP